MRPTLRLVLLAAAGLPVSLGATLLDERLWPAWVGYLAGILLLAGVDGLLALPGRRLALEAEAPDTLYMGEADPLVLSLSARGWRRPTRLELVVDLGADLEPVAPRTLLVPAGQTARVELPLVPRRRGTSRVEAVWLTWHGPFGLMRRIARRPVGAQVSVVPNLRAAGAGRPGWSWWSTSDPTSSRWRRAPWWCRRGRPRASSCPWCRAGAAPAGSRRCG